MSTNTSYYNLKLNKTTDDTLVALVSNQNTSMNIIDSTLKSLDTDIEIINTAILDTGTVNAIVVNTVGTFDLTKNGNITPFIIPLFTNTNIVVTISIDGQTTKLIKKANVSGTMTDLELSDIKKNVPCQLVWDSVNDFFIFAPKGGSNIKSIQYLDGTWGTTSIQKDVTISAVNRNNSIIFGQWAPFSQTNPSTEETAFLFGSDTVVRMLRNASGSSSQQYFIVVVEFNNVKSKQSGNTVGSSTITISAVDKNKSILVITARTNQTTWSELVPVYGKISDNVTIVVNGGTQRYWQVIEFI